MPGYAGNCAPQRLRKFVTCMYTRIVAAHVHKDPLVPFSNARIHRNDCVILLQRSKVYQTCWRRWNYSSGCSRQIQLRSIDIFNPFTPIHPNKEIQLDASFVYIHPLQAKEIYTLHSQTLVFRPQTTRYRVQEIHRRAIPGMPATISYAGIQSARSLSVGRGLGGVRFAANHGE